MQSGKQSNTPKPGFILPFSKYSFITFDYDHLCLFQTHLRSTKTWLSITEKGCTSRSLPSTPFYCRQINSWGTEHADQTKHILPFHRQELSPTVTQSKWPSRAQARRTSCLYLQTYIVSLFTIISIKHIWAKPSHSPSQTSESSRGRCPWCQSWSLPFLPRERSFCKSLWTQQCLV